MIAESILRALIARGVCFGQLALGEPGEPVKFVPSTDPNVVDLVVVMAAWRRLGRDPNMGEVGWLDLPNKA